MVPTEQMVKNPPQMMRNPDYYDDEEAYDPEDDEYGDETPQRAGGRQLSPEQEAYILQDLVRSSSANREFMKVLKILQNDPELRPLIFEHEALLRALKEMNELKAIQIVQKV